MIRKTPPTSQQPTLFDSGANAQETRAASFNDASRKQASRQEIILGYLRQRGAIGATRDEIAIALRMPVQSVTSPALALLQDGLAVETSERRLTQWGKPAAVIVAAEHGGQQQ